MQFAAVLLLIMSISFAEPIDLMPVVPGIAFIVAVFLIIMLMLSNMLASTQLMAWTKTEFRELIAGVILVALIFGAFISSQEMTKALTGEDDYITASEEVIEDMLSNDVHGFDTAYKNIIKAATKIRIGASYSPWITIPVWLFSLMYSTSPLSGISIMLIALGNATQGLTNVIYLYEGILLLIKFFHATVPTILFPLAFAVRLIPFTRRLGNTLIALCIGAVVLLPLSVIVIGEMNNIIDYPDVRISNIDRLDPDTFAMDFTSAFCGFKSMRFILSLSEYGFAAITCFPLLLIPIVGPGLYSACFTLVSEIVYPLLMLVIKVLQLVLTLLWVGWAEISIGVAGGFGSDVFWPQKVFKILLGFLENVNNVVLIGYIDLVVIAIITISGTRSVSTALGGEWYLAGVERLI